MQRFLPTIAGVLFAMLASTTGAAPSYKIVTASERGTYIQIGRDLAKFVAPAAGFELDAVPSAGSAENVRRLRFEPDVKFALVQSDVYQAYLNQADVGKAEAATLIRPLRVILPLYNEEIYFIARADSPLNWVHEIRGSKINVGPLHSGTAMSATTIYRQMFREPVADATTTFLSNEEALAKLVTDKSIDVVVIVAGQPAKVLTDMKPEARALIKLLKFDPNHAASKEALKTYFPATIRAASYPNLLAEDSPGLAVKAFLVTYDYNLAGTVTNLSRFGRALCENFDALKTQGHPKWKEVDLALPELGKGWQYSAPVAREIRRCAAPVQARQSACTTEQKILGLCE
jgi:TRAP transporter TAXI family solute receptor